MAFWKKKKSSNLVRHQRTFSNSSSLLKNYYYSLSEQNVGSSFTGKSKVNTIWSSLSSLTLVSQKEISFRGIPSSVTPTLPESFSPSWQLVPSVCVLHCSFPAGSFSYVFFSLRPCFLEPRLALLLLQISCPTFQVLGLQVLRNMPVASPALTASCDSHETIKQQNVAFSRIESLSQATKTADSSIPNRE